MARIFGFLLLEPIEVCELSLQRRESPGAAETSSSSGAGLSTEARPASQRTESVTPDAAAHVRGAPHSSPESQLAKDAPRAVAPLDVQTAENGAGVAGFEVPAWAFDQLAVSRGAGRGAAADQQVGSTTLPGRTESARRTPPGQRPFAHRHLAGKPLMEWVVRRASDAQQLDEVVVVLPRTSSGENLAAQLPVGTRIVQTDKEDRLARLIDALRQVQGAGDDPEQLIEGIVELRLDCPLLDPCLIDRLVSSVRRAGNVQYATFCSSQTALGTTSRADRGPVEAESKDGPSASSGSTRSQEFVRQSFLHRQLGLFAEYYSVETLEEVHEELTERDLRSEFGAHVRRHPERYQQRLVQLPEELDQTDLRFSLRLQEDWAHAEQIVEALGDDQLDWQGMIRLLQDQPVIRSRMATLNRCESTQR